MAIVGTEGFMDLMWRKVSYEICMSNHDRNGCATNVHTKFCEDMIPLFVERSEIVYRLTDSLIDLITDN